MEWGQPAQLITKGAPSYDINTGKTTEDETIYNVKIVITALDIRETGGLYQANDVKIVIDPVQINYIYLTEADYFLVPRDGAPDQYLKIIEPKTFRGDKPVGYVIVARPQ
jgi:hypothetical protein